MLHRRAHQFAAFFTEGKKWISRSSHPASGTSDPTRDTTRLQLLAVESTVAEQARNLTNSASDERTRHKQLLFSNERPFVSRTLITAR